MTPEREAEIRRHISEGDYLEWGGELLSEVDRLRRREKDWLDTVEELRGTVDRHRTTLQQIVFRGELSFTDAGMIARLREREPWLFEGDA